MYSCFFENKKFLAFMKTRNSLVFRCREERVNWVKKTKYGEKLFLEASANRFWLNRNVAHGSTKLFMADLLSV